MQWSQEALSKRVLRSGRGDFSDRSPDSLMSVGESVPQGSAASPAPGNTYGQSAAASKSPSAPASGRREFLAKILERGNKCGYVLIYTVANGWLVARGWLDKFGGRGWVESAGWLVGIRRNRRPPELVKVNKVHKQNRRQCVITRFAERSYRDNASRKKC